MMNDEYPTWFIIHHFFYSSFKIFFIQKIVTGQLDVVTNIVKNLIKSSKIQHYCIDFEI